MYNYQQTTELAFLIKRLCSALMRVAPNNTLPTVAMNFLKARGLLEGSALRFLDRNSPLKITWDEALGMAEAYLKSADNDLDLAYCEVMRYQATSPLYASAILFKIASMKETQRHE